MINPSEVENIEVIGELQGSPIKMIKLIGGLYLISGKERNQAKETCLASGSHPAIVKHTVEKKYRGQAHFQMQKSEIDEAPVKDQTSKLPETLVKKGFELYSTKTGKGVTVILNKDGKDVTQYQTLAKGEEHILQSPLFSKVRDAKFAQGLGVSTSVIETIVEEIHAMDGKKLSIGPFDQDGTPSSYIEIGE